MDFPLVSKDLHHWPSDSPCRICGQSRILEPNSFAALSGGALLMDRQINSGGPDDRLDGFLNLTWHGAHDHGVGEQRDVFAQINIAEDVRRGQFDLYFCSTKCLREFFNHSVDSLEVQIDQEITKRGNENESTA